MAVTRNLKVGLFTASFNDMTIHLGNADIPIVRTYDSRNTAVGDFGVGWSLDVAGMHLEKQGRWGTSFVQTSNQHRFSRSSNRHADITRGRGAIRRSAG